MTSSAHNPFNRTRALLSRRGVWQALSLVVSVALMVFVLSQVELSEFLHMVRRVPVWVMAGAFLFYLLLAVFRTLRFRAFMGDNRPGVLEMLPIVMYHNFLTRVLPFKTGEISYVLLLNRFLKQPVTEGISSLLSARLFELALVLLGGAFGLLSLHTEQSGLYFVLMLVLLGVYIVGLYQAGPLLRLSARLWTRTLARPLVRRWPRWDGRVEAKLEEFAGQFARIQNPRLLLTVIALSACTFSMAVAYEIVLIRGVGLELPLGLLLAIIAIKMFIEAAPIAVSGFGVIESSWMFGFVTLAGMDAGEAAALALYLHVAQVLMAALAGLIGWLTLSVLRGSTPSSRQPVA